MSLNDNQIQLLQKICNDASLGLTTDKIIIYILCSAQQVWSQAPQLPLELVPDGKQLP